MGDAVYHYANIKQGYVLGGAAKMPSGMPEMRRKFDLVEIHERHHEIARRLVLGQPPKKIAEDLGVTYHTVITTKNLPSVQEQINLLSGARDSEVVDVAKQIRELAPKCLKLIEDDILDCEDGTVTKSLKFRAATDLLDRAGHSAPKNVNLNAVHAIVTPQDLVEIKRRAIEIAEESGVIDLEPS